MKESSCLCPTLGRQLLLYKNCLQSCKHFEHPLAAGSEKRSGINSTIHTHSWDWPEEFVGFRASTLYFQDELLERMLEG